MQGEDGWDYYILLVRRPATPPAPTLLAGQQRSSLPPQLRAAGLTAGVRSVCGQAGSVDVYVDGNQVVTLHQVRALPLPCAAAVFVPPIPLLCPCSPALPPLLSVSVSASPTPSSLSCAPSFSAVLLSLRG